MTYFKTLFFIFLIISSCNKIAEKENSFTIAFGSCNNQVLENKLWPDIKKNNPDVWIWGGDIIYSDTEDMNFMELNYNKQKSDTAYFNFIKNVDVLATWDDHDYGLNDGGIEYAQKATSQKLFLDFLNVPINDIRRQQEGIYFAKDYTINNNSIKIILLDTRYFRTQLTEDTLTSKRYQPNVYGEGSILGEKQWKWLENELENSEATFNIIVSSIQFLSAEHGFESWGNMPHEVDKFENLLVSTKAKNIIILSGDRHISEISKKEIEGLNYPLIDFTSSGMTHSYTSFKNEPNKFRIVDVVSEKNFGILRFDFNSNSVKMEIKGENNVLFHTFEQKYQM